jgi:hypothetical protein
VPNPSSADTTPSIARQKQDGHIRGAAQHRNRLKQGNPTSISDGDSAEADALTREAWAKGTPVPGRVGVREHDFGRPVGKGQMAVTRRGYACTRTEQAAFTANRPGWRNHEPSPGRQV